MKDKDGNLIEFDEELAPLEEVKSKPTKTDKDEKSDKPKKKKQRRLE
jgi:hypothetical protein